MKIVLLTLFLLANLCLGFSQKRDLDYSRDTKWKRVGRFEQIKISSNGKFVVYGIIDSRSSDSLVIQATDNSWKQEIANAFDPTIANNDKWVAYRLPGDSFAIFVPDSAFVHYSSDVQSYKTPEKGVGKWLALHLNDNKLILLDLIDGLRTEYSDVTDYHFNDLGDVLLIKRVLRRDSLAHCELAWVDLNRLAEAKIWEGYSASDITFNKQGNKLAFIAEKKTGSVIVSYAAGMGAATEWVNSMTPGMCPSWEIRSDKALKFSADGNKLFFSIKVESRDNSVKSNVADVDVWNYQDGWLPSEQSATAMGKDETDMAVLVQGGKRVTPLGRSSYLNRIELANGGDGDYVLAQNTERASKHWEPADRHSLFLVSTETGERLLIKKNVLDDYAFAGTSFSPTGKFVIWYDREKKNYFTFTVQSKIIHNITSNFPVSIFDDSSDFAGAPFPYGIGAWLGNDQGVLIYDKYDVWLVDPEGRNAPSNLTNRFGRKNNIVLRCFPASGFPAKYPVVEIRDTLLFVAFSLTDKNSGFFAKQVVSKGYPTRLILEKRFFNCVDFAKLDPGNAPTIPFGYDCFAPIKAPNAKRYIILRESAVEAPNLFSTSNFKDFTQLTEIHPQKEVNWMTTELVHWKMFNGKRSQGILYKPEDFDPKKKYPILFYFYERESDALNYFIYPELSAGPMNVSWFVTKGYLVFVPDIYYEVGYPGESVYNSVASAAEFFTDKPWVNSEQMGIQGHSFGGYEVNYLVTRTNKFAAAASAAGCSDYVSMVGQLRILGGGSFQQSFVSSIYRIGSALSHTPQLYIKNSPVLRAANVSTPLLIMHNKNDGAIPWAQGVEYFLALRQLGKKVWMLQYDHEGHNLVSENTKLDYTIRLSQFFDHFLKKKPEPVWMNEGVNLSDKAGRNSCLETKVSGN
jgi:dipeptidyl aminopeptidase/acylaminoacyl peptidase